jgi:ketosteroid isomerase-like protein
VTATDDAAIRNLIARFAEATDVGTLDEYAACLTDAATMLIGDAVTRTGRSEIVAAMAGGRAQGLFGPTSGSTHVVGASVVEVKGDEATASTSFVFIAGVSGQKQVVGTGRYSDALERTADGWRVAHRRVQMPE